MFKRNSALYLQDILISVQRIEEYTKGLSSEDFEKDWKTIDAVVRNKIIHEYFGVDTDILWKTIKDDLPPLKKQIEQIS